MLSVDFYEIELLQNQGRWEEAGEMLGDGARRLQTAGADLLVICTNTMHMVAPQVEASIDIPLLHIADPTGEQVTRSGLSTVALLGTRFTMEQDFYRERLESKFDLSVIVPDERARDVVHAMIYDELVKGVISELSRERLKRVVAGLEQAGAEAIVLGCTELGLLLRSGDVSLPVLDTAELHAEAAADLALGIAG
jgi:aspartate racemase